MTSVHDLLTEPLLSWRDAEYAKGKTTLPGLLALLGNRRLADFPRLRAHQFHPWSMFLTQLAAIALRRAGEAEPRLSEEAWRQRLLALTEGEREPWCLVVDDLGKAAFFQPPVPEEATSGWSALGHPDELDILVTSKGHDVKVGLISPDDAESWVYALVTLQTMQGYPGRGYNGIARMNGGYGNRARVGLMAGPSVGARFARDLSVLLETWPLVVQRGYPDDGIALTWTVPWDGKSSLSVTDLSPQFIETCWRTRLAVEDDRLMCRYTTTQTRRCAPEVSNGDVGDPWMPIERAKGALTIGTRGFHYDLLSRLLFDADYAPAPAQELRSGDPDPILVSMWALARGQGKTEGLHERTVPLSGPVRRLLGQPEGRDVLGRRASLAVRHAKTMRSKVLFPALKRIALGDTVVADRFDARVDEEFFEELFASIDDDEDTARHRWERKLQQIASRELQSAIDRCSLPDSRRYRAISEAESMFTGCLKKHFPDLFPGGRGPGRGSRVMSQEIESGGIDGIVHRISGFLRHGGGWLTTGDIALLRRTDPRMPRAPFFKLAAMVLDEHLPDSPEARERQETRWAAVVVGLALLGPLHRPGVRLGRALIDADFSELRFSRLLQADADRLLDELPALARFLSAKNVPVDWSGAAWLMLSADRAHEERVRRSLAREYYGAVATRSR